MNETPPTQTNESRTETGHPDVLSTVPQHLGYSPTNEIAYFVRKISPIHADKVILAQLWESSYVGIEDVWVVVPTIYLPPLIQ